MCRAARCSKCNKTTWAGCGAHVDQVMRNVPPADRCRCAEVDKKSPGAPKSAEAGGAAPQPSLWDRLLGR